MVDVRERVGELMATGRIESELKARVIQRNDGDGKPEYMLEFLNEDGSVRAVKPTEEIVWKIQLLMYALANDLAGEVMELAGKFSASQQARAVMTEEMRLLFETAPAKLDAARTDGYEDGWNAARAQIGAKLLDHRVEMENRRASALDGLMNNRTAQALDRELGKLDSLMLAITLLSASPVGEVSEPQAEAEAISTPI